MRDRVLDHVSTDITWSSVRSNWMAQSEINWLIEHDYSLATRHSADYLKEHQPRL